MSAKTDRSIKLYHAAWRRIRRPVGPQRKYDTGKSHKKGETSYMTGERLQRAIEGTLPGRAAVPWRDLGRGRRDDAVFDAISRIYQPGQVVIPGVVAAYLGCRSTVIVTYLDRLRDAGRWHWKRISDSA